MTFAVLQRLQRTLPPFGLWRPRPESGRVALRQQLLDELAVDGLMPGGIQGTPTTNPRALSVKGASPIDRHDLPRDEVCRLARQEQARAHDVFRPFFALYAAHGDGAGAHLVCVR